ncbi:hypothetical protein CNR37_00037 [Pseudomonas phage ventosus]|uniref:Uncharacterized protein n=1 Tax=Pseudomonas phage ventosus TaxID=2048980 RepID=A0A2H4P7T3_9CAUD|nr:hypothetical protein CNR37_00037 [Pseudomonas phage ventosus]
MKTLDQRWEEMTSQEQDAVRALHAVLAQAKNNPEQYENPVQLIEDMEFTLQGLWKFDRSVNHHTHWIEIKGCTCPKMDNRDHWGTGRITISNCPWHWKEPEPHTYVVSLVSASCDHYLDTFKVKSPWDLVDAMKEHYGDEFYYMDQVDITSPDGGQAARAERYVISAIEEGEDE